MNLIDQLRGLIGRRRTAYVRTFNGPFGQEVLADLARFCRANETTYHPDPRIHAELEGRREVWLRLQRHLQLSDDELWELYKPAVQHMKEQ